MCKVRQRYQETLPKVKLLNGWELQNRFVAKWVGMTLDADGNDDNYIRNRILYSTVVFGQHKEMLRCHRLRKGYKISKYKGSVLTKATFGCEVVRLTARATRRYKVFNARCSSAISGRSYTQELRDPSFNIMAWIHWRRAVWLGKGLRGEKGELLLNLLHWGFQHQRRGDVFDDLPQVMKTSFDVLVSNASSEGWKEYLDDTKPVGWTWYNGRGEKLRTRRRSARVAKQNERSLRKEELRRSLVGRRVLHRYCPTSAGVPEGELHVYTDGSASRKNGNWRAGCGVWFAEGSSNNIITSPRGKQTVNRAELTAIILAIRKALSWETEFNRLVVHTDSMHCADGISKWRHRWRLDGWTRRGRPLKNADL